MKKLKIISKTQIGVRALQQHVSERLQLNRAKKFMLKKTGYNEAVTSHNPYILEIWATNNSMFAQTKLKHVEDEIGEALKLNNAEKDIDYFFEGE